MTAVLYPVGETAEQALHAPRGFAAREQAAGAVAGAVVTFVCEPVGPAFATREAALDAYAGRLEDDRPGAASAPAPEARWCSLRPVTEDAERKRLRQAVPVNRDGRRWPEPAGAAPPVRWRLTVSYWRIGDGEAAVPEGLAPARRLRRAKAAEALDPAVLRALAHQPLRAVRAQQPLDIGLFETSPPEAPHILMPDE